jgi:acyl-CoA thioesterase
MMSLKRFKNKNYKEKIRQYFLDWADNPTQFRIKKVIELYMEQGNKKALLQLCSDWYFVESFINTSVGETSASLLLGSKIRGLMDFCKEFKHTSEYGKAEQFLSQIDAHSDILDQCPSYAQQIAYEIGVMEI